MNLPEHDPIGMLALGDALESQLGLRTLLDACPAPSHRWFNDQRHKVLSLALDAIDRGEIDHDQASIMEYLSRVRWLDALDALKGKPIKITPGCGIGDTALAGASIASLMSDAATARMGPMVYGTPAKVAVMLRNIATRKLVMEELTKHLTALSKVAVTDDAGPILATLGDFVRTSVPCVGEKSIGGALGTAIANAEREAVLKLSGKSRLATWGLPSLDSGVPLKRGGMYVLSASPGGGKTSLALQSAYATAQRLGKRSVAYLSMEMSAESLALKLACRETRIPSRQAEDDWGSLTGPDQCELRRLQAAWETQGGMWVRDSDAGAQTLASTASWVRSQQAKHGGLELLIVDYLGLLSGSANQQNPVAVTAEITKGLKQLALSEKIAIILLAQINREGRKPGKNDPPGFSPIPRVEFLLGGSSIESDADAVIFLHKLEKDGDALAVRIDAIIDKNRNGKPHVTNQLWFYGKYQHFQDVEQQPPRPSVDHEQRMKDAEEFF
jgi:KaiC/GvpD/RAD55 family RecA-like ATPase